MSVEVGLGKSDSLAVAYGDELTLGSEVVDVTETAAQVVRRKLPGKKSRWKLDAGVHRRSQITSGTASGLSASIVPCLIRGLREL